MDTVRSTFFQFIKRKESLLFLVLITAGITLCGWLFDNIALVSFSLKYKPMSPIVALTFIALSILLFINMNFEKSRLTKPLVTFFIIIIALIYSMVILGYVFNFANDIENFLFGNLNRYGNAQTGYMSPIAALLFFSICISFLSVSRNYSNISKYIGGSIILLVFLVSSILSIAYLYNAPLLFGNQIIPVALPATICFLLLSITLLRIYELKFWTFNLIKDNQTTIQLLKWFLPINVISVTLFGYLIISLSVEFKSSALLVAIIALIMVVLIIYIVITVTGSIGEKIHKAEQAVKESEKQLLRLNADKDRFISILGHDLKSPFNNILGFSEVLTEDIRKLNSDEIEDIAKNIYKSAKITNKLLEDILMWARTQQGRFPFKPLELSLADICKNVLEILNPTAFAKNITIYDSTVDHINVYADIDMLKTILLNLVSNAIKFTNKGGSINISANQTDSEVTISVSDNGVGITPDNLTKLFDISEVLTTIGTAGETGTGLGLLLCKEFVEKHQGKIWVESEVGRGSTFYFTVHYK